MIARLSAFNCKTTPACGNRCSMPTAAMGNYLHDDDEGEQDAQMKRMKRREI
jgi:hypothetical protein